MVQSFLHDLVTQSARARRVLMTVTASAGAAVLLGACAGGDTSPTGGTSPRPSLSQSAVTVQAGEPSVSTTLRVSATSAVSLSARNADGIFVTFAPAVIPVGSESSTVSIAASTTVAAGTYPIAIIASRAAGVADTVSLTLTVTAAPLTGTAVTLRYCAEDAPLWLAVRENNGLWTRITPNSGSSTYQFRVAATLNPVGIASVDTVGTGYHLRVTYARDFELAAISDLLGRGECASGAASGSVVNAGTPVNATVALANSWVALDGSSNGQFTLSDVAGAPQDLIATRLDARTSLPSTLLLRRGLTVGAAGGAVAPLDFDAAEAFAPWLASVEIRGLSRDSAVITTAFRGVDGRSNAQFGRPVTYAPAANAGDAIVAPYMGIPLPRLLANELQQVTVTAKPASPTTSVRSTTVFFRDPAFFVVDLAGTTTAPLVTRQSGAHARARMVFGVESPYGRYVTATFSQPAARRFTSMLVTPVAGSNAWDFAIPDLSGVPGWNNDWGLSNSQPIAWSVTAAGGRNFRVGPTPTDGAVLQSATHTGTLPTP